MHTLADIARHLDGRLDGPGETPVRDLAAFDAAGPQDLVFVNDARYLANLEGKDVGGVLCRENDDVGGRPAIRVDNPRLAAARAVAFLHPRAAPEPGVHATATVAASATVPASCSVGPYVVIEDEAVLGENVEIGPHCVVGRGATIGEATRLDPRVVLYPGVTLGARCEIHAGVVIGSPGFGYEPGPDGPEYFPQNGTVVIGDDVRIGSNTTIDRATFAATRIGDGTKIDNLVQIGHNAVVEDRVMMCAMAALAGESHIESDAIMGPKGALSPNAVLGAGTILGAKAALASHQKVEDPGKVYMGAPAFPMGEWMRYIVWRNRGGWKKKKRS